MMYVKMMNMKTIFDNTKISKNNMISSTLPYVKSKEEENHCMNFIEEYLFDENRGLFAPILKESTRDKIDRLTYNEFEKSYNDRLKAAPVVQKTYAYLKVVKAAFGNISKAIKQAIKGDQIKSLSCETLMRSYLQLALEDIKAHIKFFELTERLVKNINLIQRLNDQKDAFEYVARNPLELDEKAREILKTYDLAYSPTKNLHYNVVIPSCGHRLTAPQYNDRETWEACWKDAKTFVKVELIESSLPLNAVSWSVSSIYSGISSNLFLCFILGHILQGILEYYSESRKETLIKCYASLHL